MISRGDNNPGKKWPQVLKAVKIIGKAGLATKERGQWQRRVERKEKEVDEKRVPRDGGRILGTRPVVHI